MYSVRFEEDFVRLASVVKHEVDLLNELEVSTVYHCDGLLLCVGEDEKKEEPKLVLWNPHLSQTRWIEPRQNFNLKDMYAIGYSDDDDSRNHKILRFVSSYTRIPECKHELACKNHHVRSEIYEIRSNSWRVLNVLEDPGWRIDIGQRGVTVKGNTYFFAGHLVKIPGTIHGTTFQTEQHVFLVCFDFAKEKFGPRLPLPFDHSSFDGFKGDIVTLSSFLRGDDEQLAVLFGGHESGFFEIWVTFSVDPNRASWSKFLRMEPGPFCGYGLKLMSSTSGGSFFVDEKNRSAVLFELYKPSTHKSFHKAFLFVQDRFKSSVILGEAAILQHRARITNGLYKAARPPLVCSSPYRPTSVRVNHPPVHTRKCMSPSATQKLT